MKIIHSLDDINLPINGAAIALGVFDGVHLGHKAVLNIAATKAKELNLIPCVFSFTISEIESSYKQNALYLASHNTQKTLFEQAGMEFAIALPFETIRNYTGPEFVNDILATKIGAKLVCCGYNYSFGKNRAYKANELQDLANLAHIQCTIAPEVNQNGLEVSSTRIREMILCGNIIDANKLLGRYFSIDFEVVSGKRIGRTLGTPTINQPFPPNFAIPLFGVYATLAYVDGIEYKAVTSVGVKPTVGSDVALAETYIHDFAGDLYGRKINVSFLEFIRPEKKFESIDSLRDQIMKDVVISQEICKKYIAI